MSICIYRHKKLYVVMPRTHSTIDSEEGIVKYNFARVKGDFCEVSVTRPSKDVEDYLQCFHLNVKLASVGNPTRHNFHWSVSALGSVYVDEEKIIGNTTMCDRSNAGALSNLMWSFNHRRDLIAGMMETMCSRSIIEILMHETEVDAENYVILQMYFNDDHSFVLNTLPIRPYAEAIDASYSDKSESVDEWSKLFEASS